MRLSLAGCLLLTLAGASACPKPTGELGAIPQQQVDLAKEQLDKHQQKLQKNVEAAAAATAPTE